MSATSSAATSDTDFTQFLAELWGSLKDTEIDDRTTFTPKAQRKGKRDINKVHAFGGTSKETASWPASPGSYFQSGTENVMLRSAIRSGITDENQLANLIFFKRHPERNGRLITRDEPNYQQLSQEWLRIRDTLVRPVLRSTTPSVLEPLFMPVEGGLRMRVPARTQDSGVAVRVGGVAARTPTLQSGWVYATAPPRSAGSQVVTLTQAGQTTTIGSIDYAEDLVPAVQGAVGAYIVALRELVAQREFASDVRTRERIIADRDMRANAVDTVTRVRAKATGGSLQIPAIEKIWTNAAGDLLALESAIVSTQPNV